jgi:catalase (peroxidase I)
MNSYPALAGSCINLFEFEASDLLRFAFRASRTCRRECEDAKEKFVNDFVAAWNNVMNLDRFDLA